MGVIHFDPEEAIRKMNRRNKVESFRDYLEEFCDAPRERRKELMEEFGKYKKIWEKLPEFDYLGFLYENPSSAPNPSYPQLQFWTELTDNKDIFLNKLQTVMPPNKARRKAVSWMEVPTEVMGNIYVKTGSTYYELLKAASRKKAEKEKLETAIKEISKELVERCLERGMVFSEYVDGSNVLYDKIDGENPHTLYERVLKNVRPSTVYDYGEALRSGLWVALFPLWGIPRLIGRLIKGAYRSRKDSGKELLKLKNAAKFLYHAYRD